MIRDKKGFTLLELMIVVTIIGILMAVAIPNFMAARDRAQFGACQKAMSNIRDALSQRIADCTDFTDCDPTNADMTLPFFLPNSTDAADMDNLMMTTCSDQNGGDWTYASSITTDDTDLPEFCFGAMSKGRSIPSLGDRPMLFVGSTGSCPKTLNDILKNNTQPTGCPLIGGVPVDCGL